MGRLRAVAPPLVAGVVLVLLWQGVLTALDPEGFVLPTPTDIGAAIVDDFSAIRTGALNTGFVAVSGLLAGMVLGVLAALAVTAFRTAGEVITPLAVAVNAIPIIALAPIFNAWFGLLSPRSNQMVVVVLVFFPIFINTARGLTEVDESQLELMDSYAAGRWRVIRDVRIPNALPFFFTALKLSTSLAVIGAIVAEYFGGRQDALGPIITQNAGLTRYAEAWAAVAAGALLGGLLYAIATLLERLLVPWDTSRPAEP
ncbi:MAG: ABC transporter permease subunit [Acidimicrobiia bacterium]|nr:ABC transporter permease subunit [Acidimicrobiia bacterium]